MFTVCRRSVASLVLITAIVGATGAEAAGDRDAARGIMAEHCSGCHALPGQEDNGSAMPEALPFLTIASDPATYTEQRLRRFLRQPHWPMTQFQLSPSDIDNIVAYLRYLNTK